MKKILVLALLCGALQTATAQTYGWVNLSANLPDPELWGGLGDVVFVGEKGWLTQAWYDLPRRVYYTPDGGQTFVTQTLPDDAGTIGGIFVRENLEGYIVTYSDNLGNGGKIFHCDDASTGPWTLYAEISGSELYCITFPPLPSTTGYIGSAAGDVWTINGPMVGYDGNLQTNYDIVDLSFPVSIVEGWAADGLHVHHRTSAGWVSDQNFSAAGVASVCFRDNLTGWMCGDEEDILRTTDGHNWIHQFGVFTGRSLTSIRFCDLQNGWAVGNGRIHHTLNGGSTWISESSFIPDDTFLKSVSVTGPNTAYAVGETESLGAAFYKYTLLSEVSSHGDPACSILPNPTEGPIHIISSLPVSLVEIRDLTGRVVIAFPSRGQVTETDLGSLPKGVYLAKVEVCGGTVTKRVVLK